MERIRERSIEERDIRKEEIEEMRREVIGMKIKKWNEMVEGREVNKGMKWKG